ncbi:small ribosomal subunit protein mS33 [Halyomorpha halys]|uniref:small ribosomal subunit protein mS33 n=1 Tax=Halyomorpha halys TaxID=286706 RepID=UPI0006D4D461|nr:28S ribosomal protein S33, mitochondrial [Halyomorpha halys]
MSRYTELIKLQTKYSMRMNFLKNRIFGDVTRPTNSKSMKVVKLMSERPIQKNPEKTDAYYPRYEQLNLLMHHLRNYGLYRDEHRDFQEEMQRLRELRGKRTWKREKKEKKEEET